MATSSSTSTLRGLLLLATCSVLAAYDVQPKDRAQENHLVGRQSAPKAAQGRNFFTGFESIATLPFQAVNAVFGGFPGIGPAFPAPYAPVPVPVNPYQPYPLPAAPAAPNVFVVPGRQASRAAPMSRSASAKGRFFGGGGPTIFDSALGIINEPAKLWNCMANGCRPIGGGGAVAAPVPYPVMAPQFAPPPPPPGPPNVVVLNRGRSLGLQGARTSSPSRTCLFAYCMNLAEAHKYTANKDSQCFCQPQRCECNPEAAIAPMKVYDGEPQDHSEPLELILSCNTAMPCIPTPACPRAKSCRKNGDGYSKCVCYAPGACSCWEEDEEQGSAGGQPRIDMGNVQIEKMAP